MEKKKRIPYNKIVFTKDEEEKIINFYERDLKSCKQIGRIIGVDGNVILRLLHRRRVNTAIGYRKKLLFEKGILKSPTKINLDGEKIVNMYSKQRKKVKDIAEKFDCDSGVIRRILREKGVKLNNHLNILDRNEIKRLYLGERKSGKQIAEIMNCSDVHVLNNLKNIGVKIRDNSESQIGVKRRKYTFEQRKARGERVKQDYINHPELRKKRSKQFKKNWKEAKKSGKDKEIGKKLSKSLKESYKSGKIKVWNKDKTHLDDSRILAGENIHTFNNWSSFEPYDKKFTEAFRRLIRKRDNQICMLCNIHREKLKKAFDVHHINYNKELSVKENAISLCNSCHTKTNFNRPHWKVFFQSLLSERYNYKYKEGEIVLELNSGGLKW